MSILKLQIIATAITISWFEVFRMHKIILGWFNLNVWDDLKPFSCFFCTSVWLGVCVAIGSAVAQYFNRGSIDIETLIYFIIGNFIVSRVLDSVIGYDSLKR